jgi:diadenosine tetraphosphatase ApaH/serine/threonine PP2A family protein phosphatase
METFVLGDLHGCGEELASFIRATSGCEIILVGDIFDRGLHAPLVWDLIHSLGIRSVLGNHDYKIKQWLLGARDYLPVHYYVALNMLVEHGVSPEAILAYLQGLPQIMRIGSHVIVHAGVVLDAVMQENLSMNVFYRGGRNLYAKDIETLQGATEIGKLPIPGDNDKDKYWWDMYTGEDMVIYGHLVSNLVPRIRRNSIGLDTAVVHGGKLTGYCLETGDFLSISGSTDWYIQLKEQVKLNPVIVNKSLLEFVKSQKEKSLPHV